jgi:hypothetical protein
MADKTQVNVRIVRLDYKRPWWAVRVSEADVRARHAGIASACYLPGSFRTWKIAELVALNLAAAYRFSGYNVTLDTKTCRRRVKRG